MLRPFFTALAAVALTGCAAEPQSSHAETIAALHLTGRVVDAADILSPQLEAELDTILERLEKDTKVQLVVATTPDLGGNDINDYSLKLANAWGIGSDERDDGLLLLVAPNERKVRIEVGIGLEASVKDEEAGEIIRNDIIPAFRVGQYEQGVSAGVTSLVNEVTTVEVKEAA